MDSETLYRNIQIDSSRADAKARTVEASFSSTEPVERYDGLEILSHAESAIDMSRALQGLALLLNHDPNDSVGIVENIRTDGTKLRGTLRFGNSQRAKEVWKDVQDGIMKSLSVGYRVLDTQTIDDINDQPAYMATLWQPYEASLVSIAADTTVGIGRSTNYKGINIMEQETQTRSQKRTDNRILSQERERVSGINAMIRNFEHKVDPAYQTRYKELANELIENGSNSEPLADFVRQHEYREEARTVTRTSSDIGLTHDETQRFSFTRAILGMLEPSKYAKNCGFEMECSAAVADKTGLQPRGLFVPNEVLTMQRNLQQRDLITGNDPAGGYLVGTDHMGGSFIELLRNNAQVIRMGATMLPGLTGNVAIPKQTGSATATWIGENEDGTDSDSSYGSVTLSPRTIAASTPMSRRMLLQSSPGIETIVQNDLARVLGLGIDLAALYGSGAGSEPLGVTAVTGVNTKSFGSAGAPTWAEIIDMETLVSADNAANGSLGYLMDSAMRGALKGTVKDSGSGQYIWTDDVVNGYQAVMSNQMTTNHVLFGNFADILIGEWGVLDIMPDRATNAASGGLVLRAFQDVDIAVRHAESFCLGQ